MEVRKKSASLSLRSSLPRRQRVRTLQLNRRNNSNLPGYENIIIWREWNGGRRDIAGLPEYAAGCRVAGDCAETAGPNGIEAAGIRARGLPRLYGRSGGVPCGRCLLVLSGDIRDAGEQRGVRENFARLPGCGCEDVEAGKSRCGVSLYQRGRDQRREPHILVEGEGANRKRIDGARRRELF